MPRFMQYPNPNPDGTNADRRVEVGWSRQGSVQVGTTKLLPGADPHGEFTDVQTGPTGEWVPAWQGAFVDLNREQINELIRNLRRARDQAYGHDE